MENWPFLWKWPACTVISLHLKKTKKTLCITFTLQFTYLSSKNFQWYPKKIPELFLSTLQNVIFSSGYNYFFMLAVIFCLLKNYHPMQEMMSSVIDVYQFGQEILTIGIFWIFLNKYIKKIPVNAAKNVFFQLGKKNIFAVQLT